MTPGDVVSRLQLNTDAATRPVASTQEVTDKLSDLVAGQRVLAEIQAHLPNGTYRAIINQREVTLALPFSAKSGDALELEVVDSDGKITLAVTTHPSKDSGSSPSESVPTTLSRTGQLISNIFGRADDARSGPAPTLLNGNQPISAAPPRSAHDLLPLLKQAITQSGMFYESHQAEWVDGRMGKAALLQEPQGKLSSPPVLPPRTVGVTDAPLDSVQALNHRMGNIAQRAVASELALPTRPGESATVLHATAGSGQTSNTGVGNTPQPAPQLAQLIAPDALPLVQQQLEALATQNFSWQGQVWPGQEMRWEIEEDAAGREQGSDETASNWQTRLRLTLPALGEVEAQISLKGNQISLALTTGSNETRELLRTSTDALRSQLDEAGLGLTSIGVSTVKTESNNGQAAG